MWIKLSFVLLFLGMVSSRPNPNYIDPNVVNFDFSIDRFNGETALRQRIGELLYKLKNKFVDVGQSGKVVRRYVRI